MKKFLLAILPLFFACSDSDSETPAEETLSGEIAWSRTFGGSLEETIGNSVPTPDGGTIVIGYSQSSDGDVQKTHEMSDIWLSKIGADGSLVWSKTLGGSLDDYGTGIAQTQDGNFIISGYSASSDHDIPGNIGMHDFFLAKIDGSGNVLWSKNYGFMSHDHAHKVIATKDGGFFIAGYADYAGIDDNGQGNSGVGHEMRGTLKGTLHGVGEFFGVKVDSEGTLEWYRYFGGTMNDRVNDIAEASDGGILMCGYSESTDFDITANRGSYDYWVVKLHSDGELHWKQNYGGSGIDQAFSIVKTNNNSFLIAGRSNSTDGDVTANLGNFDAWIVHINDHGDLLWQKSFGGVDFDVASSIRKTSSGKFLVSGNTRGSLAGDNRGENDFWVFEIDNLPNTGILWQKTLGGSGIDMATDAYRRGNEIIVVGESQSADGDLQLNKGATDLWIAKLK